jgi:hypothetical protein
MIAMFCFALIGCSATSKTMAAKSQSERTDVFQEIAGAGPIPAGHAEVVIKAALKTHLVDYYAGESKESAHGNESYPFLMNIDGQAVLWNVPGAVDSKPAFSPDGTISRDPEARDGMQYLLEKKIRLLAGQHTVFFGLPGDNYFVQANITVKEGESATLEYKPVYRYKTMPTRISTFMKGFSHYDVTLNGDKI